MGQIGAIVQCAPHHRAIPRGASLRARTMACRGVRRWNRGMGGTARCAVLACLPVLVQRGGGAGANAWWGRGIALP
ncbi:hypothetical protein ABTM16_19620, partial [Acinetobacter baumannii]